MALALLVLLTASAPGGVRVDVLSLLTPQRVEVVATGRSIALPGGGHLAPGARLVVERQGGRLTARAPGGWRWSGERLVVGESGGTLEVDVRGRDRRARMLPAPVELATDGRRIRIVAVFALEDLVASAVAAELDQVTDEQALEAAAVAIRSYLVASPGRHAGEGFDVCDTTHCVHSRGLAASRSPAARATRAASRLVLTREGRVVAGYCTACCGGRTATPALVWGGADGGDFESVACAWCAASSYYRWQRVVRADEVARAVEGLVGRSISPDFDVRAEPGPGAWVRSVVVADRGGEARVGGDAFRMAVERRLGWDSVPSPRFTVERRGGSFVVRGGGYGHGIGLCITGAVARARAGARRDAILAAYFPRARVELLGGDRFVYSSLF